MRQAKLAIRAGVSPAKDAYPYNIIETNIIVIIVDMHLFESAGLRVAFFG